MCAWFHGRDGSSANGHRTRSSHPFSLVIPLPGYRLTNEAAADLEAIAEQGVVMFGRLQAVSYHASLVRTFEVLADFPGIALPSDNLKPGLYRLSHKAHMIFLDP